MQSLQGWLSDLRRHTGTLDQLEHVGTEKGHGSGLEIPCGEELLPSTLRQLKEGN